MRRLITISAVSLSLLSPEVLAQVAMGNIGFRGYRPYPDSTALGYGIYGFLLGGCWRIYLKTSEIFGLKAMCFDIGNVSLGGGDYRPASELGRSATTQLRMP